MRWYKSPHILLTTEPNLTITKLGEDKLSLQLSIISSSSLRSYKCQAENELGKSTAVLILTGKSNIVRLSLD